MLYRSENLVVTNSQELQIDYGAFEFKSNVLTIIRGKSGIGKTTLLKVLGLLSWNISSSSDITLSLYGKEFSLKSLDWIKKQQLRKIYFGYIFQEDHLLDSICVLDNILFPSLLTPTYIESIKEKLHGFLDIPFLNPLRDKMDESCSILSGGEKKKVDLLRAILKDPDILIADEPWTNLGGDHEKGDVKDYIDFFIEQRKNKSTILATHDQQVITKYKAYEFVQVFELVEVQTGGTLIRLELTPIN